MIFYIPPPEAQELDPEQVINTCVYGSDLAEWLHCREPATQWVKSVCPECKHLDEMELCKPHAETWRSNSRWCPKCENLNK